MIPSIVLTSIIAAGTASAAVARGSWGVRADFSRCKSATPLEAVLEGAAGQSSPSPNIIDFKIPSPFDGALIIKAAGAAGYGSPYHPQQVRVEVFAAAKAGDPGVWANATVTPGTGQPASVAQIQWSNTNDVAVAPADNKDVSLGTTFEGDILVVYYCGIPDTPPPFV